MNLTELMKMRGFDTKKKIKLVRHQDPNYDTKSLYKNGMLDFYQSLQSKDVFGECDYILSFLGDEGRKALFIGAYEKINVSLFDPNTAYIPYGYPYMDILNQQLFHYEFSKTDLLVDMIDCLVIDWGPSSRSWHQWVHEDRTKQVIEILPFGYIKEFPGFTETILTYEELSIIVRNPDANRIWHTMLSSVAGIYLIVDTTTGNQYVGSASGQHGLLGRWRNYVDIPHGGNSRLTDLLQTDPIRYKSFQFSILHTLPKSMVPVQVYAFENLYKQ